jgi:hypothetical protein
MVETSPIPARQIDCRTVNNRGGSVDLDIWTVGSVIIAVG